MRMIRLKVLALVSMIIALQGCETVGNIVPSIPEVMARNKFEGKNIQQAYTELGKPTEVVKASDGQSMAVWVHVMGHQVTSSSNVIGAGPGPNGVSVTPTSSSRTLTRRCDIQITFDKNMIITRYNAWNREPLACTQYYNGG
jgi:hypothetical protein